MVAVGNNSYRYDIDIIHRSDTDIGIMYFIKFFIVMMVYIHTILLHEYELVGKVHISAVMVKTAS